MDIDRSLILNQFRSAPYTYEILNRAYAADPDRLCIAKAWLENMDQDSLGNDLCLPVAACTAVNILFGKKIIGDAEGSIRVGDFFKVMLPFHSSEPTGLPAPYDQGWRVIDSRGNVYHHAIAAFIGAGGLYAYPVQNFDSVAWPFKEFSGQSIVFAVSLANNFVSLEYPGHLFKTPGRHVVDILGFSGYDCVIGESYQFLSGVDNPRLFNFPVDKVDQYLRYFDGRKTQGIIVSRSPLAVPKAYAANTYIPDVVQYSLSSSGFWNKLHEA